MIRLVLDEITTGDIAITGDDHHYLGRVRRARVGDELELIGRDGRRADATIARMTAAETIVRVDHVGYVSPFMPRIRVLVPLIKGDRMDLCLEKLVEAGADRIVVWAAERSIVKLDPAKLDARLDHYKAVAAAAARQSGAFEPQITYVPSLRVAVAELGVGARLMLDPNADRDDVPVAAPEVNIISGPEGGFAPAELDLLTGERFEPFGLGPRVLRAETAPVIAVALVRAATNS
jgi:16S rRNA (uracil1498-N3)-methyltransferase